MKKNPKISVITVCYNSEQHLEQCIKSVVEQDYENKEYIIIDGGSTDGTLDIINRYKDHIAYFKSEPDKGISDAFNKGLKVATGDLIEILNSDDYMMPNVLSRVASEYEEGIDVYRGYCEILNVKNNSRHKLFPNNRFGLPPIGGIICHESSFISSSVYNELGGYKEYLRYGMDLDFFIRMKKAGVKHKFIDVCVDTFRTGGASSTVSNKVIQERKRIMRENGANWFQISIYLFYHFCKNLAKKVLKK